MSQVKSSFEIQLSQLIDSQVMLFIDKIVQKHNLDKDELFDLWKEDSSFEPVKKNVNKKVEKVENICTYIGANTGSKCTTRIRGEGNLCSKHKPKTKLKTKSVEKEIEPVNKSKVLRMHRIFKKFYHPETGFVFKSKEEKKVIGKIESENIEKLNSQTIDECKAWGFPYEIEEENENEEESESEEE
jgi:hypothetical protein